jgi:NAD(P)-dependent dehydrogenase (short-subunit alcohol dehydrogenase family)
MSAPPPLAPLAPPTQPPQPAQLAQQLQPAPGGDEPSVPRDALKALPKHILVTGGVTRIGAVISRYFAAKGWAVSAHYHQSSAKAQDLARQADALGQKIIPLHADLRTPNAMEQLISTATTEVGTLGVLINNASIFQPDTLQNLTLQTVLEHQHVNLLSPLFLMQAFANYRPQHTAGVIINIIDNRVWNLQPSFLSYTLSKAGLWTLTQSLALALAPTIRVNAIGPGPTLPNHRQSEADFRRQWQSLPLARPTAPEEIAHACDFLISTPSLTGQMLCLDGGEHLAYAQASQGFVATE